MPKTQASTSQSTASSGASPLAVNVTVAVVVFAVLVWSYWEIVVGLVREWQNNQDYSVGQLVPLAAVYLIWQDRATLRPCRVSTCWWGLVLVLLGEGARWFGLMQVFESAGRYGLVLTIVGLVLLIAGSQIFFRIKWVLLFLFLMVPLPGRVHQAISGPLQSQATSGAVFFLELFGVTVVRDGNVILLNDTVPLAVAEACSGLRMLTAFVVVGCVLAYVVERPTWQKAIVVASTVPVAIACNLFRLVVTAFLFLHTSSATAERFFHDFAGWTMMPMAIGLLVVELWVLRSLVLPDDPVVGPSESRATRGA